MDPGANGSPTASPDNGQPGTGEPSASASPTPDAELIQFEISDGVAEPSLDRVTVEQGTTVRIEVTSDEADELHLHGYDLHADVGPGEEGVIEFVADEPGLFELETHDSGLLLLQLAVQ